MDGGLVPFLLFAAFIVTRILGAAKRAGASGQPPRVPQPGPQAPTGGARRAPRTLAELLAEMQAELEKGLQPPPVGYEPEAEPVASLPVPVPARLPAPKKKKLPKPTAAPLDLSHDAQAEQIIQARRAAADRPTDLAPMKVAVIPAALAPMERPRQRPAAAVSLLRGSVREGMIWREILDRPVSMRGGR